MVLLQSSVILIFPLSWLCAIPLQEWEEKAGISEGTNCPSVKYSFPTPHVYSLWKQMGKIEP